MDVLKYTHTFVAIFEGFCWFHQLGGKERIMQQGDFGKEINIQNTRRGEKATRGKEPLGTSTRRNASCNGVK